MIDTLARLEPYVLLVVGVLALAFSRTSAALWDRLLAALRAPASRPWLAATACASIGGLGSAAVALFLHWPLPTVHDEFCYLLSADTFAHGRLSNPTHPMWRHFETIHVFHQPTYACKYPPAQGLLLALGLELGGTPVLGLWIGAALLGAALYWMLQAWLPRRWAFVGGLLGATHYCVTTYWTQSFWGGAPAAIGGALLFGALGRMLHAPRAAHGLVFGAGLGILALSRPYEGLLTALAACGLLCLRMARSSRDARARSWSPAILCAGVVCAASLAWLALYQHAVTGDALRMPYQVHEPQYAIAPNFLWLPRGPVPEYRHPALREYWEQFVLAAYESQQTLRGWITTVAHDGALIARYYLGPELAVLLVALPCALRRRGVRFALGTTLLVALGMLGSTFRLMHYPAPLTTLVLLVLVQCMRALVLWKPRGRPLGKGLCVAALAGMLAFHAGQALRLARQHERFAELRAGIGSELEAAGGEHLILVRYGPKHSFHEEWVYNGADLDGAQVLWARDMGTEGNRELLEYYPERRVWRLDAGFEATPARLEPYSP